MSVSRKFKRRMDRQDIVFSISISIPLPKDIQPWEYELLLPHLQAMLEAVIEERQASDDDEQGQA